MNYINKSAIALRAGIVVALLAASGAALAQSPTGNITGMAKAGDTALIENVDTGFSRSVGVKENGRYQLRNLPTGTFKVTVKHADGSVETPQVVTLHAGRTVRIK